MCCYVCQLSRTNSYNQYTQFNYSTASKESFLTDGLQTSRYFLETWDLMRTKNNFGHRASFSNWHGIFTNTLPAFFFRLRVLKENHRELGYFHARNPFTKTTQTYYIKILLWMYCAYWIDYFNSLFILRFLNLGWKIKLIARFFIVAWITYIYIWQRFKRYSSHHWASRLTFSHYV